jgi:hypothetical protein
VPRSGQAQHPITQPSKLWNHHEENEDDDDVDIIEPLPKPPVASAYPDLTRDPDLDGISILVDTDTDSIITSLGQTNEKSTNNINNASSRIISEATINRQFTAKGSDYSTPGTTQSHQPSASTATTTTAKEPAYTSIFKSNLTTDYTPPIHVARTIHASRKPSSTLLKSQPHQAVHTKANNSVPPSGIPHLVKPKVRIQQPPTITTTQNAIQIPKPQRRIVSSNEIDPRMVIDPRRRDLLKLPRSLSPGRGGPREQHIGIDPNSVHTDNNDDDANMNLPGECQARLLLEYMNYTN